MLKRTFEVVFSNDIIDCDGNPKHYTNKEILGCFKDEKEALGWGEETAQWMNERNPGNTCKLLGVIETITADHFKARIIGKGVAA